MSDESIKSVRQAVKDALDAQIPDIFMETWLGPRSTEVGYRMATGEVGALNVTVKNIV